MSNIIYMNHFFKTKKEAEAFIKKNKKGLLCSNTRYSTAEQKSDYRLEANMTGRTQEFRKNHPYCVAWNEVEKPKKTKKSNFKIDSNYYKNLYYD